MNNRRLKAQSAMEYLMTYGWAILIIAVVLGALFSLGVFSGASLIGNACIAGPGYYCGSTTLMHGTGAMTAQVGQSTGSSWANSIIVFVAQGSSIGTNGFPIVYTAGNYAVSNGLVSGQLQTETFTGAIAAASAVGTPLAGAIWACYVTTPSAAYITYLTGTGGGCYSGTNTVYYTQIATLTTKAV
jgi:hypothetical protein